jgi:integrase
MVGSAARFREAKTVHTVLRPPSGVCTMPRLTKALPKYQKHRTSGQAVVTLDTVDYYLGPHGTKTSRLEYDRLIAEWLTNGRRMPVADAEGKVTVMEVLAAYKRFAEGYYVKNGKVTNEVTAISSAMRIVKRLYGKIDGGDFGPLKLQAVQQAMVTEGWSRKHINKQIGRVVRIFSWAESKEMVPKGHTAALREVPGLHQGRTTARETAPVLPVADEIVQQTLPHMPEIVSDMVRLQRMTGARPEEVCTIRPCDIDMTADVWAYVPPSHKTQHHGKRRVVFIGPRA